MTRPADSGTAAAHAAGHAAGMEAGIVLERLREHDRHFEKINGSMGRIADEMSALKLAVQELSLQARADGVTRIATAAALKDADEERRHKSATAWSPLSRIVAVMAGLLSVITLVGFIAAL